MDREAVKRLPVLDDLGRLVGIVTRSDLLRVHLRSDAAIRADVVQEVLRRVLAVRDGLVTVQVRDGAVTLDGRLDRRTAVDLAGRLAAQVSGVVTVTTRSGTTWTTAPRSSWTRCTPPRSPERGGGSHAPGWGPPR